MHRQFKFSRAMSALLPDPARIATAKPELLADLAYGWGNEGWSGEPEYLLACLDAAETASGPLLECGSGLTTLLVGQVAKRRGLTLHSFEHMPHWAQMVRNCLHKYSIDAAHIHDTPIQSYGAFDWYGLPALELPDRFAVVICDGPPSNTRGGRSGLVPVMRARLEPGCVILLDDAGRASEQAIAKEWSHELPATCRSMGTSQHPFFAITVGNH
jgi:hypothetical protein